MAGMIERAIAAMLPSWGVARAAARFEIKRQEMKAELLQRSFEAAGRGRRNDGWRATGSDANSELAPALARMRNRAREQRRNNPYAESGIAAIADYVVGHGIVPRPMGRTRTINKRLGQLWKDWGESLACDADGMNNFYGIQHLAMETIAEAGEVLLRRRRRYSSDGLPVPLQIQVLEPDYLDELKDGDLQGGGKIIQGVEFDALGRRVAFWLFPQHPGASGYWKGLVSQRVPAEDVLHIFLGKRPGQARGYTWLAPVIQRMKNLDEMDDALIEQAKVAACFAAFVSSDDNGAPAPGKASPLIDRVEPGIIERLGPNESVTFGSPPTFSGYQPYSWQGLHAVSAGLGVPYEILTQDLKGVSFISGRLGWLRFYKRVDVWQWRMLIPLLCEGVWKWFLEAQALMPGGVMEPVRAEWVPPRKTVVDPKAEQAATKESIRNGQMTWSDSVREQGITDPQAHAEAIAADNKMLDDLGLVLDCDPRKVAAAGSAPAQPQADDPAASNDNEEPAVNGDENASDTAAAE